MGGKRDKDKEIFVLGLETATLRPSFSFLKNEDEIGFYQFEESEKISENLLPGISKFFEKNGLDRKELDLIVVSNGPGSLTGIRIGLSVGKGLARGLGINCLGIPLFEGLEFLGDKFGKFFFLVSAGENRFFWKFFNPEREEPVRTGNKKDFLLDLESFPEFPIYGDQNASDKIKEVEIIVRGKFSKMVAWRGLSRFRKDPKASLVEPNYFNQARFRKLKGEE